MSQETVNEVEKKVASEQSEKQRRKFYFSGKIQFHLIDFNFQITVIAYIFMLNFLTLTLLWTVTDTPFVALGVVAIICVSLFYSIMITHRIAGPLHSILKTLKKINNSGEMTKVSLRDGDFFQDLADEVNQALETVAKKK